MRDFLVPLFENALEFANPEYLGLLPLALVLMLFGAGIFALRLRLRPVKTFGSTYPLIGHIKFWFLASLALAVLVVAAARPFWISGGSAFKRGNVEVVVIVDGSASMWARDLGPSRLEIAVREALALYTGQILTPGDRVALFVFGTTGVRKAHLSSNAERFVDLVGRIAPPETLSGDAFPWDSDVASAFEHVYQSIDNQDRFEAGLEDWAPARRSDRLALLFTDGDFVGDNAQMARLDAALVECQRRGLTVYPVGVGTRGGVALAAVLPDAVRGADRDATLEADLDGIRTRLDTAGLQLIAQRTGGRAYVIDQAGTSAAPFLRNAVDSHRSISVQLIPTDDEQEVWQWLVILAVAIFVVAIVFH
jgi:hypothetical protein